MKKNLEIKKPKVPLWDLILYLLLIISVIYIISSLYGIFNFNNINNNHQLNSLNHEISLKNFILEYHLTSIQNAYIIEYTFNILSNFLNVFVIILLLKFSKIIETKESVFFNCLKTLKILILLYLLIPITQMVIIFFIVALNDTFNYFIFNFFNVLISYLPELLLCAVFYGILLIYEYGYDLQVNIDELW